MSTETPSIPGFYWTTLKTSGGPPFVVCLMRIASGALMVQVGGQEKLLALDQFRDWDGPLSPPRSTP